ncbi:MAG: hypothetical protein M1833_000242 [Piccolia ochrophora]|nr:MAG: hypothetical protein M1833_000242 [Piccolia ochrophora]
MFVLPELARRAPVTSDNQGPIVTIAGTVMMIWMLLCYLMRLGIRFGFNGPFKSDDAVISAATVFGVAQTIATYAQVGNGLGRRQEDLNSSTILSFFKASPLDPLDLLYVVTVCLSRVSVALLIARLTRSKKHLVATHVATGFAAVWGVAALFTIAALRWEIITGIGVFIEIILLALPVFLVWGLQMPFGPKAVVVAAFSFRLPVIATTILRIIYLRTGLESDDMTFDLVTGTILSQVDMHYSLMAATIPCMKPFVKAFNTGYYTHTPDQAGGSQYGYGSAYAKDTNYALQSVSSQTGPAPDRASRKMKIRPDAQDAVTVIETDKENSKPEEAGSVTTHGSDKMMIRRTVGWNVRYDEDDDLGRAV